MGDCHLAGFPGVVGSSDATHHDVLESVQCKHRQSHLGFKMTNKACTYNITVIHRWNFLSTTRGHPAHWNDKALSLFDPFMSKLYSEEIWTIMSVSFKPMMLMVKSIKKRTLVAGFLLAMATTNVQQEFLG